MTEPLSGQGDALDFKRWRQAARRQVRIYVKREREAPGLTLWASEGSSPRRAAAFRVGAAEDGLDVRAQIVEAVKVCGSSFAAIGRPLLTAELEPTTSFGLLVVGAFELEAWESDVSAGQVGAWERGTFPTEGFEFVQQALRAASRRA